MLQVGSAEEASRAADAGVDIIVAQGVEAGGHVRGQVGLLPLLPTVVEAVTPVPVVAAGGIVDGRGLAAALALGADGVWVGTRFVASTESEAHADYKKRLLAACQADAIYTEIFHVGWPPNSAHRVLRNPLTEGSSPPAGPVGSVRFGDRTVEVPVFGTSTPTIHTEGSIELMPNYAGQGVGLVRNILPAAEIVQQMVSEAEAIIRRLSSTLT
jgi:nitronate monooxygenase